MYKRNFRHRSLFSSPVPKAVEKPKIKWRVWPILWGALRRTCTFVGAIVLVSVVLTGWSASRLVKDVEPSMPGKMVLYLTLNGDLDDLPHEVSFADPLANVPPSLKSFTDTLYRAKNDPRVYGLYARIDGGGYSLAHLQEMRAAIIDFRKSGKFAYVFSPSYGESGGMGAYYLASSFDEVWMQPMGIVSVAGLSLQEPFFRDVLDKIGVEPQFFQRKEYKTAYESLNNSHMSQPNREMMGELVGDLSHSIMSDLAEETGMTPAHLKTLVDRGIFVADEALRAGLLDKVDYSDVLVDRINSFASAKAGGEEVPYVNFEDYMYDYLQSKKGNPAEAFLAKHEKKRSTKPGVALIYAVGVIMPSSTEAAAPTGLMDDGVAAADDIAGAIEDATDDDNIKVIVLRVNSPGGSPTASETILRAVSKAQKEGKKVIVSMGPTAASGGYWISAYADRIFVLPTTLTGSIGVLGGKVSAEELWKKVGVNWEGVQWGANSGMWSMNAPFSKGEAERMNAMLDNIYDGFLARVAKGRKMSVADVDKIARGRVWSGAKAIKIGLADEIGSLDDALDYAAVQAGAKDRHGADVRIMPEPLSPLEKLVKLLGGQVMAGKFAGAQSAMIEAFKPIYTQYQVMTRPQDFAVYNKIEVR
ncbi:MAG: signal peptide peptidase SppA [Alphaproteobacteria bacterium]|nr:signal peptide peptidase SppA [Alphaproteobacteria bacterium]